LTVFTVFTVALTVFTVFTVALTVTKKQRSKEAKKHSNSKNTKEIPRKLIYVLVLQVLYNFREGDSLGKLP
jgi:hypothetical protein